MTGTRSLLIAVGCVAFALVAVGCSGAGSGGGAGMAAFVKQAKLPVAEVPTVSAAPKLDGDMDAAYAKAKPLSFVILDGSAGAPKAKTTAYLVSTADTLFIFVKCDTAKAGEIKKDATARDGDVFKDDYVEVFLCPGTDRAGTFYQFAVNPAGTIIDVKTDKAKEDKGWDSKAKAAAKITKEGWQVELAIPMSDLGVQPGKLNKVWVANVGRFAVAEGEDLGWCPTGRRQSFTPSKFGFLWLDAGNVDNSAK